MARHDWNESYASGNPLPWDTGHPDPMLVQFIESGEVKPGRALEIGSGTGTNAIWLAQRGFQVLGVDVAPLAVDQAREKLPPALSCRFQVMDFLADAPPEETFDFVFDRGCFHIFDEAEERARFAARVAAALVPGGSWLSLCGSTEGPPRDMGPPRRSARDLVQAIEPELEIRQLRSGDFGEEPIRAWLCHSQRRTIAAQPSTRRS